MLLLPCMPHAATAQSWHSFLSRCTELFFSSLCHPSWEVLPTGSRFVCCASSFNFSAPGFACGLTRICSEGLFLYGEGLKLCAACLYGSGFEAAWFVDSKRKCSEGLCLYREGFGGVWLVDSQELAAMGCVCSAGRGLKRCAAPRMHCFHRTQVEHVPVTGWLIALNSIFPLLCILGGTIVGGHLLRHRAVCRPPFSL